MSICAVELSLAMLYWKLLLNDSNARLSVRSTEAGVRITATGVAWEGDL